MDEPIIVRIEIGKTIVNYPNKYLDNLKEDFPDWNNENKINLGLINNHNDENDIKNAFQQKYPNLNVSNIEIINKEFSYFLNSFGGFLSKIRIKESSNKYSHCILAPKFSYVSQNKLNEISNIIANDSKVKQWIKHINDYNENLPTKIEHLKTYVDSQKWTAKNTEKEIIKAYIRDWSYVHTLIEHELKLDELNKNVQGLKLSFESLKNEINTLDNRVNSLWNDENEKNSWNCANIADKASTPLGLIPEVGKIASVIAKLVSGTCKIMKL